MRRSAAATLFVCPLVVLCLSAEAPRTHADRVFWEQDDLNQTVALYDKPAFHVSVLLEPDPGWPIRFS